MTFAAIITLLEQIFPLIDDLVNFIKVTPEEQRADVIADLHSAFQAAQATGDTSGIEKVIASGK